MMKKLLLIIVLLGIRSSFAAINPSINARIKNLTSKPLKITLPDIYETMHMGEHEPVEFFIFLQPGEEQVIDTAVINRHYAAWETPAGITQVRIQAMRPDGSMAIARVPVNAPVGQQYRLEVFGG